MQQAWEIFTDPGVPGSERMHYAPYELIVAPTMRRFLPQTSRVTVQGRPREVVP